MKTAAMQLQVFNSIMSHLNLWAAELRMHVSVKEFFLTFNTYMYLCWSLGNSMTLFQLYTSYRVEFNGKILMNGKYRGV
jgi:hypothetical protein